MQRLKDFKDRWLISVMYEQHDQFPSTKKILEQIDYQPLKPRQSRWGVKRINKDRNDRTRTIRHLPQKTT